MWDYLPEEILIAILVKLPVKSLVCATSVCKQWRSLIRSSHFISTHLSNTENQALLRRYTIHRGPEHYTGFPKGGPFDICKSSPNLEFPFRCPGYSFFETVGSCDGLVCLFDDYNHSLYGVYNPNSLPIIIWNPAIRNHVVLPQPQFVNLDNKSHHFVFGFGAANNVYKVVKLVYRSELLPAEVCSELLQAETFCLGGMGRWRKLTGFNDVRLPHLERLLCPILFKGFMHWLASELIGEGSERNSILRFHFGDEVFGVTILPEELERGDLTTSLSLAVVGESLGAIKDDGEFCDPNRCDVWMMKDYGVKESWTKLYTIDCEGFSRAIGFWGSGKALVAFRGRELATYNPETKGIRRVGVCGDVFYMSDYKESLVLLRGYSG